MDNTIAAMKASIADLQAMVTQLQALQRREIDLHGLSDRETLALRFIIKFKVEHGGISPTIREVMYGIGLRSTSSTRNVLFRLADTGLINLKWGEYRNIEVVGETYLPPIIKGDVV